VTAAATGEVVGEVLENLGPGADVAVVVASGSHAESIGVVVTTVRSMLGVDVVLWATSSGVVGGSRGIEDGPGLSLFVARVGPVVPVVLGIDAVADDSGGDGGDAARPSGAVGIDDLPDEGTLVLVSDGRSPVARLLDVLAERRSGLVVAGGLVPARLRAGLVAHGMGSDPEAAAGATAGRAIARGVVLPPGAARVVVSQGCRAIGDPMVVTRSRGPVIEELAGRDALDRVDDLIAALAPDDRTLAARHGLQLGWVVDERAAEPTPGDLLVRNVVGAVKDTRAIAVDEHLPVGSLVQFHLRDPAAAAGQLRDQLVRPASGSAEPGQDCGALLFTCNGRGRAQFASADHDPTLVVDQVGPAVAGLFCAGEIGPVGGRSWVHSLTATTVVLQG
jgi:small ligand-binding sensory domain FIST